MFRKMALTVALVVGLAPPFGATAQAGMDLGAIGKAAAGTAPIVKAQYFWNGYNYCWYPYGWRGPGWYWCGYEWSSGLGWGGGFGWHGWRWRGHHHYGWRWRGHQHYGWRGGARVYGHPGFHHGFVAPRLHVGPRFPGGGSHGGFGGFHGGPRFHGGGFHGGGPRHH